MSFRVLVVCTGNICRSPVAEQLLQGAFPQLDVDSAGTGALVGHDIDSAMIRAMREAGISPLPHRAKQITDKLVTSSDLVLTMEEQHRGRVLESVPLALKRTYTLREFARILTSLDAAQLAPILEHADLEGRFDEATRTASRNRGRRGQDLDDNIDDPYRRPAQAYIRALSDISEAVERIHGVLGA